MKEATGEANMTVITIVLIAIVLAIGTPIITKLISGTSEKAECVNAGYVWSGGKCNSANCHQECGGGSCWDVCS